ncbi:fungal specific transcription factor [Fusarium acutatum]|uniref:Fungal specific transcription factor n=1 Tax=Fusarium acutatum TaxID=78861 RepID=A0A8H4JN62_9HYPO|nr:fungal specific transcription factor [Fusarium acutatum]
MAILNYVADPALPGDIKEGIDQLYDYADKKDKCTEWASYFSKDARLIKGDYQPTGVPALVDYMEGSWKNTESRVHDVRSVSVVENSPLTLKIEGVTTYQRTGNREQKGTWTAQQRYTEEDGKAKIDEYKIEFNMLY